MPAHRAASSRAEKQRTQRFRIMLAALYFGALSMLILWEYRERLDFLSSECPTVEAAPKSAFYSHPYRRILDWASPDISTHVSVIAIPSSLEEIQSNICTGRAYLADMLQVVAAQHPAEIVIDKTFSPGACASDPQPTRDLLSAVQALTIPVVVGESTETAHEQVQNSCLVRKSQLDFASPNVHRGITRLNVEAEKVPLQWRVMTTENETASPSPEPADSLAWAAVKAYDPTYAAGHRIRQLIDSGLHPYAHLHVELPRETSTELFCSAAPAGIQKRWAANCTGPPHALNLLGKVVVIGSESETDHPLVLGSRIWGFDLQARYIEVLLSGNYLRALPFWAAFLTFASFVFVIEALPTVLEAWRPRWKKKKLLSHAYKRRRYAWIVFWSFAFLILISAISLAFRYLPPLVVLGDVCFVAITRLLFFAAESTETPFLHSK